jgi:hypothetical protein
MNMKRIPLTAILCVLMMVLTSSSVSAANHNFGTAITELWYDSVDATCPEIDDWEYSLSEEEEYYLDVEITCQFKDDSSPVDFTFNYILEIELWQQNPPMSISLWGVDDWRVTDNSANWLNVPVVHQDILSEEIAWISPQENRMYKCRLTAYIYNDEFEISDEESDSWFITCVVE